MRCDVDAGARLRTQVNGAELQEACRGGMQLLNLILETILLGLSALKKAETQPMSGFTFQHTTSWSAGSDRT